MRADEGYSYPSCGTREQVRDSRTDHRLLHVSVGIVRSFAGPSDWMPGWGNAFANSPVFGRSVESLGNGANGGM